MTNQRIHQAFALMLLGTMIIVGFGCGGDEPTGVEDITIDDPLTATPTGSLSGQVEKIEGVQVDVRLLTDGKLIAMTKVDLDGNYRIDDVNPGAYTVEITADGYEQVDLTTDVIADQVMSLDPVVLKALAVPVARIRGLLTDQGTKQTLPNIRVQLIDNLGEIREALTTQAGVFEFEDLPTDQQFTLVVELDEYEKQEVRVDPILGDETAKITINLVPILPEEELPPGEGLSVGTKAPDFNLMDGDGRIHSLANYVGQKRVVLLFDRGAW